MKDEVNKFNTNVVNRNVSLIANKWHGKRVYYDKLLEKIKIEFDTIAENHERLTNEFEGQSKDVETLEKHGIRKQQLLQQSENDLLDSKKENSNLAGLICVFY